MNKRKSILAMSIATICVSATLFGCGPSGNNASESTTDESVQATVADTTAVPESFLPNSIIAYAELTDSDKEANYDESTASTITLGETISATGDGVSVKGKIAHISKGGTYVISGEMSDGCITVQVPKEDKVQLVLAGVNLTYGSAPIQVNSADKVIITLKDGTVNTLADKLTAIVSDDSDAVIFSKKDLTINGGGTLNINGTVNNGIQCKKDLVIVAGTLNIEAVNNAIRAKNSITFAGGNTTINCKGNAISTTNTEEPDKGYVHIIDGTIKAVCDKDGIQSTNDVKIEGGSLDITAKTGFAGGEEYTKKDDNSTASSAKGIKTTAGIYVTGGSVTLNTPDNAINAKKNIKITGGSFDVSCGNVAFSADNAFELCGGTVDIKQTHEGLKALDFAFNNGTCVIASDSNAIKSKKSDNNDSSLTVNGGKLLISSKGDCIDVDIFKINGGVLLSTSSSGKKSALSAKTSFAVNGGYLMAYCKADLSSLKVTGQKQTTVCLSINANATNTALTIADGKGGIIASTTPSADCTYMLLSTPALVAGTYNIYTGGSFKGQAIACDNFLVGGKIEKGNSVGSFEVK